MARRRRAHTTVRRPLADLPPAPASPPRPRRIHMTVDEKITNAASFRILREDHTVGHLLRM
jgi:hypothetical protein